MVSTFHSQPLPWCQKSNQPAQGFKTPAWESHCASPFAVLASNGSAGTLVSEQPVLQAYMLLYMNGIVKWTHNPKHHRLKRF